MSLSRSYLQSLLALALFSSISFTARVLAQGESTSYDQGLERMSHRDFDGAILSFNQCVGSNRQNADGYFKRGQCFYYLQKYQLAIDDFTVAINCNASNSDYYLWRGVSYCKKGENPRSIMDYEQALRVNPTLLKAASGAGAEPRTDNGIKSNSQAVGASSPEKNAKNEQSVQNYLEAVRIVNSNLFASFVQGTVFGGIVRPEYPGDHEKAYLCPEGLDAIMKDPRKILDSSRQELESKPGDAIALFHRGLAYQQMGIFQKALDDLDSAIQVQQNNTQFLLARAYLQHMNKNDAAAKMDLEKARLVDASLPAVIKF